jgi:hypothetical protein
VAGILEGWATWIRPLENIGRLLFPLSVFAIVSMKGFSFSVFHFNCYICSGLGTALLAVMGISPPVAVKCPALKKGY